MTDHRIKIDRTRASWNLGVAAWTNYRYRPVCSCGYTGDKTKSMELAVQQAERHVGYELDQVSEFR